MPDGRILIADDEDSLRWVLEKGFRGAGYQVTAVKDGTAALREVEGGAVRPDPPRHPHARHRRALAAQAGARGPAGRAGRDHDRARHDGDRGGRPCRTAPTTTWPSPSIWTKRCCWRSGPSPRAASPRRSPRSAPGSGRSGSSARWWAGTRRCRRCTRPSAAWRPATSACCCAASPAPARKWWRARSTTTAAARGGRSWASRRRPSPSTCSSPSCSATRRARSPTPRSAVSASSSWPTAARCSSTRSATCRPSSR